MIQTSTRGQQAIVLILIQLLLLACSQSKMQKSLYLNIADIQQDYSIARQIYDSKKAEQIQASRPKVSPIPSPTTQAAQNANIKARSQLALNTQSMGFANQASFFNVNHNQRQVAIGTKNIDPSQISTRASDTVGQPAKQGKIVVEFEQGKERQIQLKENKKYNVHEVNSQRIVSETGEIHGVINKQAERSVELSMQTAEHSQRPKQKQKRPSLQTQTDHRPKPNGGGFGPIDFQPKIIAGQQQLNKEREDGIIKIIFTALLAIGVILLVFGYRPHRAHDGQYLENRDDEQNQLRSAGSMTEMRQRTRPRSNSDEN